MQVRSGDSVLVIAGRERGKTGQISRVIVKDDRVVVAGVNLVKRHLKARPGVVQAGIVEKEAPLRACNVMLLCPSCNRPTRDQAAVHRRRRRSTQRARVQTVRGSHSRPPREPLAAEGGNNGCSAARAIAGSVSR